MTGRLNYSRHHCFIRLGYTLFTKPLAHLPFSLLSFNKPIVSLCFFSNPVFQSLNWVHVSGYFLLEQVLDIITSEHGAWAEERQPSSVEFYKLDMWQDGSRRRMRFVKNEYGSSHPEATLLEGVEGKQTGVIQGVKKSKRMIMIPLKAATPLNVLPSLKFYQRVPTS